MRRAAHELGLLVAILVIVVSIPILAIRALTMAIGSWPGDRVPEWWDRASMGAAALFVVAGVFLIWDTHRISRHEEDGVIVEHLRIPAKRRRRAR
jgi:hypothetical protein